jgi:hypothetical protein
MFGNLHKFNAPPSPSANVQKVYGDLTVRDYFAGLAMQTLLQRQDDTFMDIDYKVSSDEAIKKLNYLLSKDAYELADAMMEARK